MNESLYELIGGAAAVEAAVDKMYEKILKDQSLAVFFEGMDMPKLRNSQVAFVTMAFGGPNQYTGENLRKAHENLVNKGLSDEHFDAVVSHLKEAMEELKVPRNLINEALTFVASTRNDVLGR